ncbi:hypothetical protein CYY_001901 [Polysphondylium violaceum]|uniref:Transmembrane protein n=1 Tax=Polysphondylium violaceum TaxID=133409 RepID=A0A8J4Q0A2_9MYCE|nr:hypothetical protein CYY_001901 [Polysphondylium violaceum]
MNRQIFKQSNILRSLLKGSNKNVFVSNKSFIKKTVVISNINNKFNCDGGLKRYYSTKPLINQNQSQQQEEKEEEKEKEEKKEQEQEQDKNNSSKEDSFKKPSKWDKRLTILGKLGLLLFILNDNLESGKNILENQFDGPEMVLPHQYRALHTFLNEVSDFSPNITKFFSDRDYFLFANMLAFKLPVFVSLFILMRITEDPVALTKFIESDGYKYCLHILKQSDDMFVNQPYAKTEVGLEQSRQIKAEVDELSATIVEYTIQYFQSIDKEVPSALLECKKEKKLGPLPSDYTYDPFYPKQQRFTGMAQDRIAEGVLLGFGYVIVSNLVMRRPFTLYTALNCVCNAIVTGVVVYRGSNLLPIQYGTGSFLYRPVDNDLYCRIQALKTIFAPLLLMSKNYWFVPLLLSDLIHYKEEQGNALFNYLQKSTLFRSWSETLASFYDPIRPNFSERISSNNWYLDTSKNIKEE